ncbi:hypothetical protein PoB_000776400 [Plakobranchus ocellatus]|uniref:Uncharacterized protein n=1 Tax=Plakobranchus ocellatus TaxID=259542 RepID=A0AAV3YG34_9GAST|nr:hypothetical protein PoB_000776400 [Plakobranchus ocellatus]
MKHELSADIFHSSRNQWRPRLVSIGGDEERVRAASSGNTVRRDYARHAESWRQTDRGSRKFSLFIPCAASQKLSQENLQRSKAKRVHNNVISGFQTPSDQGAEAGARSRDRKFVQIPGRVRYQLCQ